MISLQNVTKSFGTKQVLKGLSFSAQPGRITGFVGANGAGKTTAMRILAGLLTSDGGNATIDGRQALDLSPADVSFFLGAEPLPHHMRIIDYLSYIAELKTTPTSEISYFLKAVGLGNVPRITIRECSLGMKQRLALAGTLIGNARYLVLDEPVNGMDVEGVRWIRDYLKERARAGGTILLSSHLLSELELVADDVVILKDGVCISSGSVQDLTTAEQPTLLVGSTNDAKLAQHFQAYGIHASASDGGLVVSADSLLALIQVLANAQIELRTVSSSTQSIEKILFGDTPTHSQHDL